MNKIQYSLYKNDDFVYNFDYFEKEVIYKMGNRLPAGYIIFLFKDNIHLDSYAPLIIVEQPEGIKFTISTKGCTDTFVIKEGPPSKYLYDIDDLINNTI